jgi:hypothetical protein
MTTTEALAHARADIRAAVAAHDDDHRRQQYARSAAAHATEVLLAADATPSQREHAGYYLDDAHGMLAAA